MAYFATEYTIHFDDTMAYGSHHFLTAFKFQCAARETFMFGEHIFDATDVREALDTIHLLTSDAYSRNLNPTRLGDRVAILLTLEDWGNVSARFCYRVINEQGKPICAGFQTLICADAKTGQPMPLPPPLMRAMNAMREIEERRADDESFRSCVLAGGGKLDLLFGQTERQAAMSFLSERNPSPGVVAAGKIELTSDETNASVTTNGDEAKDSSREAWVFAGQGAFDAELCCERIIAYRGLRQQCENELAECAAVAGEMIGGDVDALRTGDVERVKSAIRQTPGLLQVAIHLQNVLGGLLWRERGHVASVLLGHSFGEIAAFCVGGCFDLATGFRVVCMRTNAIAEHAPPDGGLMVVASSRHQIQIEASLLGLDRIYVAGRNHDRQTVVSGPVDQLDRFHEHCRTSGVSATSIPSPTSFHHPGLQRAASQWLEQMRSLAFQKPQETIYSPIGRRYVEADDDVAAILASQLLRPFDLQGALADMTATGVTQFVDCGSAGSLERLIFTACEKEGEVCRVETLASPSTQENLSHSKSVAIVGYGCILPAGARSPEKLFDAISQQRLGIVDQRNHDPHWSEDFYSDALVPDRSTSHLSGRVDDEDIVAPAGVDPAKFATLSRTQRLLCIALAPCVDSVQGAERVVCLVGATADGFEDLDEIASLMFAGIDPDDDDVDRRMQSAKAASMTPHQAVQEVFDLMIRPGLKVTLLDAACASSLYTVALGMQTLENGEADAVIAGGVFCPGPGNSCLFSQFNGTTSTGCRPFDAGADGVVFSEGAAFVTLRSPTDAKRSGLPVHARIRGIGLSSDGRSPSANVPQTGGQILSLMRCYEGYGIDPKTIYAIEGHGTSTAVGDSTELNTLRRFFEDHASSPIPVHSLKGLLGHAGWAAGTASVIAACEYLRRGVFPAQAFHREPSDALRESQPTLTVPTQPISLPPQRRRIAIDGFGFGGANAHLVLDDATSNFQDEEERVHARDQANQEDEELVIVGYHCVFPTTSTPSGLRFDAERTTLPEGCLVLPELADDMDLSQTLAVILSKNIIDRLPGFDDQLKRNTSLVLAMRGKTERGIEATARIMVPRLRRKLEGNTPREAAIGGILNRSRPSGPYTLQCMMPNVATGRAALLLNLNGPNFVVDAGSDSLSQTFQSAKLLLHRGEHAGAHVAIVAAIHARSADSTPADVTSVHTNEPAFAAAFGVTTRRMAESREWRILASVDEALEEISQSTGDNPSLDTTRRQVDSLVARLSDSKSGSSRRPDEVASIAESKPIDSMVHADCAIHAPLWIESPPSTAWTSHQSTPSQSILVLAPDDDQLIAELNEQLPAITSRIRIAVVGNNSLATASRVGVQNALAFDLSNDEGISAAKQFAGDLDADLVIAVDKIKTWNLLESLSNVSADNGLCEMMFLIAQANIKRLRQGDLGLWSLFLDGFDGAGSQRTVHPRSGATTGLLKSIQREIPESNVGSVCTHELSVSESLERLLAEASQKNAEPEIAYDQTTRFVRRLHPVTCPPNPAEQVTLDRDSVVVATGGARGVTFVMLESIVREHQCAVVALGRSSLQSGPEDFDDEVVEQEFYQRFLNDYPEASAHEMKRGFQQMRSRWEADRNVRRLRELGAQVDYLMVDVTDSEEVAKAVETIALKYGKIDLLIHGAGIQLSKRLEDRTLDDFRLTYSIKVSGLHHITESCHRRFGTTVNTHVLTSAYSVFGNDGQHDYGSANETLDRVCDISRIDQAHRWSSIAWLAWDGIGMTRGSEYRALAKQRNLSGIDAPTGRLFFHQVLSGQTGSAINVPLSEAEHVKYAVKTVPLQNRSTESRSVEIAVDLSQMECLPFHKVRDIPTLPGAWILDRLVHAGLQLCDDAKRKTEVVARNTTFSRFVRATNDQDPNLRVVAQRIGESIEVWMLVDVIHPSGQILAKDVICASTSLTFHHTGVPSNSIAGKPNSHVNPESIRRVSDPYCRGGRGEVDLSGPFDCLADIEIGGAGRRAKFEPKVECTWHSNIPALLLDAAWRVAAVYAVSWKDDLFVPVHIRKMVLPLPGGPNVHSAAGWEMRSSSPSPAGKDVRWDRTEVIDHEGNLRLLVENGYAKRLA